MGGLMGGLIMAEMEELKKQHGGKQPGRQMMGFCFTLNNYSDEEVQATRAYAEHCKYLVFGYEKGENGTPHLQGYAQLKKRTAFTVIKKAFPRAHLEKAYGTPTQATTYCKKDGNFEEFGDHPMDAADGAAGGEAGGEAEKARWQSLIAMAQEGRWDDLIEAYPRDYVRCYRQLRELHKDFMPKVPDLPDTTGLWIHGPSGVGKSRGIRLATQRHELPLYCKMANKWWDGYHMEPVVVLDDLDKTHSVLGHHLKIWADHYGFIAEAKGSAMYIRPNVFCVTSQYSIEQIWEDDETREALKRRFTVVHFDTVAAALKWTDACLTEKKIIFSN